MKKLNQKRGGFTLIELLIVVSIIGILSVALVPNLSGAPARARDAARKAMLSEVAAAVETYNIDLGQYPNGDGCVATGATGNLGTLVTTYLNGVPPTQDEVGNLGSTVGATPENLPRCQTSVHYTKLADGYILFTGLEAGRGGNYNIVTLDSYSATTNAADTIVPTDSSATGYIQPGTGNAHAIVR